MIKIISYNVNGIRAAIRKGFLEWLKTANPDVVCIQETKAKKEQLDLDIFTNAGYHNYWHSADKKGYSGVAILSKTKPNHIEFGCPIDNNDQEGRVIRADFPQYSLISVYVPSGSSKEERQSFKMNWLAQFGEYISNLRKEKSNLIICGDYNICHKPIDIHNPIGNAKSSGFLPEEREWLSQFIESGMIDSFREFNNKPHQYSWWTYRRNARERNLGWRLDYNFVSNTLQGKMKRAAILSAAEHSDHCPVYLEMDF
jgi:exodeoxyribonuclease-3